jgi:ABC-type uncharacterized transport system auxiliary subunit
MNRRLVLLSLATFAMAPGCAVLSEPEPPVVYRLAPPPPSPVETRPISLRVSAAPSPALVDSQRIALGLTAEKIDVYADALWADRVPNLVVQAVIEAMRTSGAYARVSGAGGERGDWVLRLAVPVFEARYDGAATTTPPRVVTAVHANLRMAPGGTPLEESFTSETRAASARLDDIVAAFNRAYGETQAALLAWVYAQVPGEPPG